MVSLELKNSLWSIIFMTFQSIRIKYNDTCVFHIVFLHGYKYLLGLVDLCFLIMGTQIIKVRNLGKNFFLKWIDNLTSILKTKTKQSDQNVTVFHKLLILINLLWFVKCHHVTKGRTSLTKLLMFADCECQLYLFYETLHD